MAERRELLSQQLDEHEDDVIALRFAFMTLARALDEEGVLPLTTLAVLLARTAEDLRRNSVPGTPGDLSRAAERVDDLRASFLLPQ